MVDYAQAMVYLDDGLLTYHDDQTNENSETA